jgi:hypothetical protein
MTKNVEFPARPLHVTVFPLTLTDELPAEPFQSMEFITNALSVLPAGGAGYVLSPMAMSTCQGKIRSN